jgi:integrase
VTIRIVKRRGERRWVIDISYRTTDGKFERYRRDAQVQLKEAAKAEHRRLEDELARIGTLVHLVKAKREAEAVPITFADAVKYFRGTHMKSGLKPTTRIGYNVQLDTLLLPRFGALPLESIDRQAIALLDAELVDEGLAPSTRARFHIVLRSVLRTAVNAGLLATMPTLPRLPKSGRKAVNPMRRADLDAILAAASPTARVAFQLAAFAGLRAGEVRGLRWPDVDLESGTLTIRRSISAGFETTPKSHHQRRIPMSRTLRAALEAARPSKASPWVPVTVTALGKPWGENGLNQAFKRAMERAERKGWSFHDLRHFFVTELFRNRAPAIAVQQLAGHADLTTTQRYADFDANDLRRAIECIDGNGVETGNRDTPAEPST